MSNINSESTAMSVVPASPVVAQVPEVHAPKTLATEFFMKNAVDVNAARQELLRLGIKTSYDTNVMIFSTLHSSRNALNNVYTQECNGLILEQKTWKPLVVPCRSLRFNIDTDVSNKFLHQGLYHIYKAQDGTCFNMYYYNNAWVISTGKGYNMNAVSWASGKTYKDVITECLERIGLTWETFTMQLDKKLSYSFGFKHPEFHKFYEGGDSEIYRVWFIQSVNLDASSNQYLWASDRTPIAIIESQSLHHEPVNNLKELYKSASCALEDFITNKQVCYGFILRSVNFETTGYHSDLFIESSLMRTIRQIWYENNIVDLCHKNQWNKETAITLNAYLDSSKVETFQTLFPQYSATLAKYADDVRAIVSQMVALSKEPAAGLAHPQPATLTQSASGLTHPQNEDTTPNTTASCLLHAFTSMIKYNLANKSDLEKSNAFMSFVLHPASLEYLLASI